MPRCTPLPPGVISHVPHFASQDECTLIRAELDKLRLSVKGVIRREHERIAASGATPSPWYVKTPFFALCWVLDAMYGDERPIARFWVLETVARIPYFAYISILHLYESLGFWRAGAELRRVHFAEGGSATPRPPCSLVPLVPPCSGAPAPCARPSPLRTTPRPFEAHLPFAPPPLEPATGLPCQHKPTFSAPASAPPRLHTHAHV